MDPLRPDWYWQPPTQEKPAPPIDIGKMLQEYAERINAQPMQPSIAPEVDRLDQIETRLANLEEYSIRAGRILAEIATSLGLTPE